MHTKLTDDDIASLKLDGIFIIRQVEEDTHSISVRRIDGSFFISTNYRPFLTKKDRGGSMGTSKRMLEQLNTAISAVLSGYNEAITETEYHVRQSEQRWREAEPALPQASDLLTKLGLPSTPKNKIERRL